MVVFLKVIEFACFSFLFRVVSCNLAKSVGHCWRASGGRALLTDLCFIFDCQELRLRNSAKGEGSRERKRMDIGELPFLVRGINKVKPLVESP